MQELGLPPASAALEKHVRQLAATPEQVAHVVLQGEQLLEAGFAKYPVEQMQEEGFPPEICACV